MLCQALESVRVRGTLSLAIDLPITVSALPEVAHLGDVCAAPRRSSPDPSGEAGIRLTTCLISLASSSVPGLPGSRWPPTTSALSRLDQRLLAMLIAESFPARFLRQRPNSPGLTALLSSV